MWWVGFPFQILQNHHLSETLGLHRKRNPVYWWNWSCSDPKVWQKPWKGWSPMGEKIPAEQAHFCSEKSMEWSAFCRMSVGSPLETWPDHSRAIEIDATFVGKRQAAGKLYKKMPRIKYLECDNLKILLITLLNIFFAYYGVTLKPPS